MLLLAGQHLVLPLHPGIPGAVGDVVVDGLVSGTLPAATRPA